MVKAGLSPREFWVYDRFNTGVDKVLKDLEWDAEQRDRTAALSILWRLIQLQDGDD